MELEISVGIVTFTPPIERYPTSRYSVVGVAKSYMAFNSNGFLQGTSNRTPLGRLDCLWLSLLACLHSASYMCVRLQLP